MKSLAMIVLAVLPVRAQVAGDLAFQFQTLANPVLQGVRTLNEGFGNQVVKGKPFSATEERHSLQVLGDGTRIENMQTNRIYRDTDGRTRVEEMNGAVSIYDPISNTHIELDPATKTARKGTGLSGFSYSTGANSFQTLVYGYGRKTPTTPFPNSAATMQGVMSETTENLGAQTVNGVPAQGVRTTMIIPKGQIGNSKDIKVMTERWSSSELQMLIKSTNSDPRFGDTTYQLTKITQSAPDPALFQIPADYSVLEQGPLPVAVGRGRGAVPGPAKSSGPRVPAPAKLP